MEYFDLTDENLWIKILQIVVSVISIIVAVIIAIHKRKIKFDTLVDYIEKLMIEAEQHKNYNGAEKLQFVLSQLFEYCVQNHIKYDKEKFIAKIENLIELTKQVNKKENPLL
ncbi:MAG: hypothetical protein J6T10_15340 [Methanobrevibacter sp.]|nr:hypothetical protein [Methanobrevibacter sp.]